MAAFKTLVIRADANTRMGTGHVMRCLALALAWQSCGGSAAFVSQCESDLLRQRIEESGMEFIALDRPHPDPSDLQLMSAIIETLVPNWVILDGYHFDSFYQWEIRSKGCRLLVIDDNAHLAEYHADVLLNQNIDAHSLSYGCSPSTQLLLGTKYALLRPEFLRWSTWQRGIPGTASRVLITLGGSDHHNVTLKAVSALKRIDIDVEIKVIVGAAYHHARALAKAVKGLPFRSEVIVDAKNMPDLMAWSDIVVTAGGSTSWELAFMGVPSIVVVIADNQHEIAKGLENAGVSLNLGWFSTVSENTLSRALTGLIKDRNRRVAMSNAGRRLVDGKGVRRVVAILHDKASTESNGDAYCFTR
jgi:UDP-2,4-diacetamido-2,4,6-trideoxy-beta-L-altropyranose hydrolase